MVSANQGPVPSAQRNNGGAAAPQITVAGTFDPDRITRVTHSLADHPLLAFDKVRDLALRRPPNRVRWHLADIPVSTNFANAAREHANGKTLGATLDVMEHAESWVFLQHIEEDPGYRDFVFEVLSSVSPLVEQVDPGMHNLHGWIFVSSPRAITPYHMDHESNFLLQIKGRKTINVWNPKDRTILDEKQLETFHGAWSLNDTVWRDEFQAKANVFDATPGTGVFMPFTAPHTVQNGDAVSITLSLTFLTSRSKREQELFAANHKLRKLGLAPRPVGTSRLVDEAKLQAFHAWTGARKLAFRAKQMLGRESPGPKSDSPY
jgi:Cupin-like domain